MHYTQVLAIGLAVTLPQASAFPGISWQSFLDLRRDPNSPDRGLSTKGMLDKRDYDPHRWPKYPWVNCTAEGTFVAGCNDQHKLAPKEFYRLAGENETRRQIDSLFSEAFDNGRGEKKPRHVCREIQGSQLCISWVDYATAPIRWDIRESMVEFAMQCNTPQGFLSSMYRHGFDKNTTDKKPPFYNIICLSNRPDECTSSPWFCRDLWLHDTKHGDRNEKWDTPPVQWDNHGYTFPWRNGPCVQNCDW